MLSVRRHWTLERENLNKMASLECRNFHTIVLLFEKNEIVGKYFRIRSLQKIVIELVVLLFHSLLALTASELNSKIPRYLLVNYLALILKFHAIRKTVEKRKLNLRPLGNLHIFLRVIANVCSNMLTQMIIS